MLRENRGATAILNARVRKKEEEEEENGSVELQSFLFLLRLIIIIIPRSSALLKQKTIYRKIKEKMISTLILR